MGLRTSAAAVVSLDAHPNRGEILTVLGRLPHIGDHDLPALAAAWQNSPLLADARARALEPDSPLVIEVLSAFEAVQSLFSDDVAGTADYLTVDPAVVAVALKAIRDAIAAAYARPILRRTEHVALMRAWRTVFPFADVDEPDLGAREADVKALLAALPRLAGRCHDEVSAREFTRILTSSAALDEQVRDVARSEAWRAAVLTSRRRLWGLVRRTGAEGMGRFCATCQQRNSGEETARVLDLAMDAACALLVADAIDETLLDVLTLPVTDLLPTQRTR